ncbi:MAG TPA: flippase-like domain-containing protein [Verrucomicrobiae bacterium]|nr:flippase-like domain-containing protein [Verrucomicrobiae bacterium]
MKSGLRILLLVAGLGVFAWYLSRTNLREVREALGNLGWLAFLVPLPYILVYAVDTLAWSFSFPTQPAVSFWRLFVIRWSGESLNNVLPTASIGGEALKVYLLGKRGVSVTQATSSAVISKTVQTIGQFVFISTASLVFILAFPGNSSLRLGMGFVLAGGLSIIAGSLWLQSRGLFQSLLAVAARLRFRPRWVGQRRARVERIDSEIAGFYGAHRSRFLRCAATYLTGWFLDTLEIFLVAFLVGAPIHWWQALIVEAFTSVAKALGMWIPGSLGVQESGIVLIGRASGLADPFCLAYALIRRGREAVFALVGWLFIYRQEASLLGLSSRVLSQRKD